MRLSLRRWRIARASAVEDDPGWRKGDTAGGVVSGGASCIAVSAMIAKVLVKGADVPLDKD